MDVVFYESTMPKPAKRPIELQSVTFAYAISPSDGQIMQTKAASWPTGSTTSMDPIEQECSTTTLTITSALMINRQVQSYQDDPKDCLSHLRGTLLDFSS
mgnify:CR=1 FL=1